MSSSPAGAFDGANSFLDLFQNMKQTKRRAVDVDVCATRIDVETTDELRDVPAHAPGVS